MFKWFRGLGLRYKISLLAGIPLPASVGLGILDVLNHCTLATEARHFDDLARPSTVASDLITELQTESGVSAGYAVSGGERFGDALGKQHALVEERFEHIHGALTRIDGIMRESLALAQTFSATSERMDREAKEPAEQLNFVTVTAQA